jgi:hypothetical protein
MDEIVSKKIRNQTRPNLLLHRLSDSIGAIIQRKLIMQLADWIQRFPYLLVALFCSIKITEQTIFRTDLLSALWLIGIPFIALLINSLFSKRSPYGRQDIFLIKGNVYWLLLLVLVGSISVWYQWIYEYDATDILGRSAHQLLLNNWLNAILWAVIGACFSYRVGKVDFGEIPAISAFFLLSFFIFSYFEIANLQWTELAAEMGVERVSHLSISDYVVILIFFSLFNDSKLIKLIGLLSGIAILLMMGSRTAFVVAALTLAFARIFSEINIKNIYQSIFRLLIISISVYFLLVFLGATTGAERFVQLLKYSDESGSLYARQYAFEIGLKNILTLPWSGSAASVVTSFGNAGMYIHNIISAWQLQGFLFFFYLVTTI